MIADIYGIARVRHETIDRIESLLKAFGTDPLELVQQVEKELEHHKRRMAALPGSNPST
jgi:hypothetical protein